MTNIKRFAVAAVLALCTTLTLNATLATAATTAPDLVVTAHAIDANGYLKIRICNLGSAPAAPSQARVSTFGSYDIVAVDALPGMNPLTGSYGSQWITTKLKPAGLPVFAFADVWNQVLESVESNNRMSF